MKERISIEIRSLINAYDLLVKGIDIKAKDSHERAYGGIIRAGKGSLVESLAKRLIQLGWENLGYDNKRLSTKKRTVRIPLRKDYMSRITSPEVRRYIEDNIKTFYYRLGADVHIYIDGKLKLVMECKAYTENAMLKRILVDFTLLKQVYPGLFFILFQLESQLGGDYSTTETIQYGSPSTHTLLSYFDIDLNIITLLEGERQIDRPIHKPEFYKPLREENLSSAIAVIEDLLKRAVETEKVDS